MFTEALLTIAEDRKKEKSVLLDIKRAKEKGWQLSGFSTSCAGSDRVFAYVPQKASCKAVGNETDHGCR